MDSTELYWSPVYNSIVAMPLGHITLLYHGKLTWLERRSIICHELGHFLGLGHNGRACMRAYVRPSMDNIDPRPYAGDYNRGLAYIPFDWQ
jgi:hypothetical protein